MLLVNESKKYEQTEKKEKQYFVEIQYYTYLQTAVE